MVTDWININDEEVKPLDGEKVDVKFKNGFIYELAWWNNTKQIFTDTNFQPIKYNGDCFNVVTHWRRK